METAFFMASGPEAWVRLPSSSPQNRGFDLESETKRTRLLPTLLNRNPTPRIASMARVYTFDNQQ